MLKRITAIFLAAALLMTQVAWAEFDGMAPVMPEFSEETVLDAELDREFAELDAYTDRYIVKLRDDSSDISNAVNTAENKAKADKADKLDKLQGRLDKVSNKEVKEKNGDRLSQRTDKLSRRIERLSGKQVIKLEEPVAPEVFIESVKQELGNSIEYIQPDYMMELLNEEGATQIVTFDLSEESETAPDSEPTIEEPVPSSSPEPIIVPAESPQPTTEPVVEDRLYNIESDLASAWVISKGLGAIVAVIDTGIDASHPDFADKMLAGYDFYNDTDTYNAENHGTHIAGIIAKTAPEAKIMPLKVFENGKAYTSGIIEAIEYAEANGATIVNCSFGSMENNQALKEAIEASSLFFVCAAGNNRMNIDEKPVYPASFDLDNVISVTSINDDLGLSYFSNIGISNVDIAAWGRDVESTFPNGEYGILSGTSMSAAYVSGAAALAEQANLKGNLKTSADKLSCLSRIDGGRKLNFTALAAGTVNTEIVDVTPEDDFDVWGYERTPQENWELFCSKDNIQVAAGSSHSLVLKADGTVWSFGYNEQGQLGLGHVRNIGMPTQIPGLSKIKSIAAKEHQSMALNSDGEVWAWGKNVGDGTTTAKNTPWKTGLVGITKISCGMGFSAVVDSSNQVWTWGINEQGQLGDGTYTNNYTPKKIIGLSNVKDVYAGGYHCIALLNDTKMKAWGKNNSGQLGDLTEIRKNSPVDVLVAAETPVDEVVSVAVGASHNIAIRRSAKTGNQTVWAWGHDGFDQAIWSSAPKQIMNNFDVESAYAGDYHTIITLTNGDIYSFGSNISGQLGQGVVSSCNDINKIEGINNIITASGGRHHTIAITQHSKIVGFGDDTYGQLGNFRAYMENAPVSINMSNVKKVSAGEYHSFAIMNDDNLYAWGNNSYGQLGVNNTFDSSRPAKVLVSNILDAGGGLEHSVALQTDGTVWTWGRNNYGQLGDGTNTNRIIPVQIPRSYFDDKSVIKISSGENHCLAMNSDGVLYAWGHNANGQLGNGNNVNSNVPVRVSITGQVSEIAAGGNHNIVRLSDNTVRTWGANTSGQIGDNTYTAKNTPGTIYSYETISFKTIAAGALHTFAVKTDGTVLAWGTNNKGGLGIGGSGNNRHIPMPIDSNYLSNVKTIEAGIYHSMAITENGSIYTWGGNDLGQLGNNTYSNSSRPAVINISAVKGITSGRYHCLVLKEDASIITWGSNSNGQLGDWKALQYAAPIEAGFYNGVNDIYGLSFNDAHEITTGIGKYFAYPRNENYFKFTPKTSGKYVIQIHSNYDTIGELYNSAQVLIASDGLMPDGTVKGGDFRIERALTAGHTYFITVRNSDPDAMEYQLSVSKSTTIISNANDNVYFVISGKNILSFANKTFRVTYDANYLEPLSLAAQGNGDLSLGLHPDTGITVTALTSGVLEFSVSNDRIITNKLFNGVINVIKFKAINTGEYQVDVSIVNESL